MAVSVTHSKVSGESNPADESLIGGEDWDDEHVISGIPFNSLIGSTVRIPVLIETKTLSAGTTTTTFSSLNGDSDEEYILKGNIVMTSDLNSIVIYPNNDDSSNYLGNNHSIYTTTNHQVTALTSIRIAQPNNNQETTAKIECKLYSTSGKPRQYHALTDHYLSGRSLQTINSGYWTNTSDNITSLVITRYTSSGSFQGTIKLYKMVDLTL